MNQMPDSNIRSITDTSRAELLPSVFCCQNAEHWLLIDFTQCTGIF